MNNIEIQWVEEAFGELSNKTMSDVFKKTKIMSNVISRVYNNYYKLNI